MDVVRRLRQVTLIALAVLASGCAFVARVSSPDTTHGTIASPPSVSDDGRFAAFDSPWPPPPGDDDAIEIYVRDLATGSIELVTPEAGPTNTTNARGPKISGDGRYVAFNSLTRFAAEDLNILYDVYVTDRVNHTTSLVSVSTAGTSGDLPSGGTEGTNIDISDGGGFVVFRSNATNLVPGDTNSRVDLFVRDLAAGTTARVSVHDDESQSSLDSRLPTISDDGRYVAFASDAALVAGLPPASTGRVYVRDLQSGTTELVSVDSNEVPSTLTSEAGQISGDGRFVVFTSLSNDLDPACGEMPTPSRDVFIRDRVAGTTVCITPTLISPAGATLAPSISDDGRVVTFTTIDDLVANDSNGVADVYVHDRLTSTTRRLSSDALLAEAAEGGTTGVVSGNGRYVGFRTTAALDPIAPDTGGAIDFYLRYSLVPEVTASFPTSLARGATQVPFRVAGRGFLPGATVTAGTGVAFTVTTVTPTGIAGTVSVSSSATLGVGDLFVINAASGGIPNGISLGKCALCLTITP